MLLFDTWCHATIISVQKYLQRPFLLILGVKKTFLHNIKKSWPIFNEKREMFSQFRGGGPTGPIKKVRMYPCSGK